MQECKTNLMVPSQKDKKNPYFDCNMEFKDSPYHIYIWYLIYKFRKTSGKLTRT